MVVSLFSVLCVVLFFSGLIICSCLLDPICVSLLCLFWGAVVSGFVGVVVSFAIKGFYIFGTGGGQLAFEAVNRNK